MNKTLLEKKDRALKIFLEQLFNNGVKDSIARIILFGSYAEGKAKRDSDVDVLILATDSLEKVTEVCLDAQLEASMRMGESVEPIIECIDKVRYVDSLFMYQVLKEGKEIYTMGEKAIIKKEIQNYLELAEEYLEGAKKSLETRMLRLSVDAGYNACELTAKGFILKKVTKIPSRHSGVVSKFGELFAKPGIVPKELGRRLNNALRKRNDARYEPHAVINKEDAEEIIELAQKLIAILENFKKMDNRKSKSNCKNKR